MKASTSCAIEAKSSAFFNATLAIPWRGAGKRMGDGLVVIALPSLQIEMASGAYNAPFLVKCKSTKIIDLGADGCRWLRASDANPSAKLDFSDAENAGTICEQ